MNLSKIKIMINLKKWKKLYFNKESLIQIFILMK